MKYFINEKLPDVVYVLDGIYFHFWMWGEKHFYGRLSDLLTEDDIREKYQEIPEHEARVLLTKMEMLS